MHFPRVNFQGFGGVICAVVMVIAVAGVWAQPAAPDRAVTGAAAAAELADGAEIDPAVGDDEGVPTDDADAITEPDVDQAEDETVAADQPPDADEAEAAVDGAAESIDEPTVVMQTAAPAAPAPPPAPALLQVQDERLRETLLGTWIAPLGNTEVHLHLESDGSYVLDGRKGSYAIINGKLILDGGDTTTAFNLALANNYLTVSGGSLAQPLVFGRRVEFDRYRTWLVDWRPAELKAKAKRIGLIVLFLMIAWGVISLVRMIAGWLLRSDRGPLSYLTPRQRNRVATIHSLLLNVVKYVVLFTTIGMILSEMGVNYTAYLASLSVIGLAIGFGSQGLVQDMVTGLFVIFEGQYDVGDLVEISGQVGVVEELGLRMTRLRNYMGQSVVIPNRNIAVVGNYARGAQRVTVDVATTEAHAKDVAEQLKALCQAVGEQFEGVIVRPPRIDEQLTLPGDGRFVRMSLRIWPGQTWVVDQQIVPRIRETLTSKELPIPGDRIVVFFYAREQTQAHPLIAKLMQKV